MGTWIFLISITVIGIIYTIWGLFKTKNTDPMRIGELLWFLIISPALGIIITSVILYFLLKEFFNIKLFKTKII